MIKDFIFTVGLPGCGKSTYLEKNYPTEAEGMPRIFLDLFILYYTNPENYAGLNNVIDDMYGSGIAVQDNLRDRIIVSADIFKTHINGYSDSHPENVHEDSVNIAKEAVKLFATSKFQFNEIIMDGGGINNHYTSDIIDFIRKENPDCKITCLFFDTPINICLKRIENRVRKVPVESIYEKNQKIVRCVNRYKEMVDSFVRVDYYTNKYIMLDMDGTIAGYSKVRFDEEGNADFVNGELFKYLRPVNNVINYVKENYDMNNVYICTAVANSIAWEEKNEWLDKYFPEIPKENRLFCGNKDYKYVFVKQFAEHMGWKRNELVLIDDYHHTILKCKENNINCLHPSNIESLTDPYAIFS